MSARFSSLVPQLATLDGIVMPEPLRAVAIGAMQLIIDGLSSHLFQPGPHALSAAPSDRDPSPHQPARAAS